MFKIIFKSYPKIRSLGLYNKKEFDFSNSIFPMNYLFAIKTGSLSFPFNNEILTISEGEYVFFTENDKIDFTLTQASDDVVFYFLSTHSVDNEISDDINFYYSTFPSCVTETKSKISDFQKFEKYFKDLIYEYNNANLMGCMGYLSLILSFISYNNIFYKSAVKDFLVSKIISYIHLNFQNPITLDDLCNLANASSTYINKLFRKYEGCTVMNYLNKHRIEVAKNEIDKNIYTIDQIAKYVGFNYKSHFCKVFKKFTGLTPTEYYKSTHTQYFSNYDGDSIFDSKKHISPKQAEQNKQ